MYVLGAPAAIPIAGLKLQLIGADWRIKSISPLYPYAGVPFLMADISASLLPMAIYRSIALSLPYPVAYGRAGLGSMVVFPPLLPLHPLLFPLPVVGPGAQPVDQGALAATAGLIGD